MTHQIVSTMHDSDSGIGEIYRLWKMLYMYRFLLERRPGCTKGINNAFNLKHIISYYFLPLIFFFKDSYLIFTDPKKRFWICEYFKVCETLRSKIPRSPIPRRTLQPIRGIEIFDNLCKIRAWKLEKLSHTRTLGNFGSSEELRRFGINNSQLLGCIFENAVL